MTLYDVHKELNKKVKVECQWFDFEEIGESYKEYNLTIDWENFVFEGRLIDIYKYFIEGLGPNVDEFEIEQYSNDMYIEE